MQLFTTLFLLSLTNYFINHLRDFAIPGHLLVLDFFDLGPDDVELFICELVKSAPIKVRERDGCVLCKGIRNKPTVFILNRLTLGLTNSFLLCLLFILIHLQLVVSLGHKIRDGSKNQHRINSPIKTAILATLEFLTEEHELNNVQESVLLDYDFGGFLDLLNVEFFLASGELGKVVKLKLNP